MARNRSSDDPDDTPTISTELAKSCKHRLTRTELGTKDGRPVQRKVCPCGKKYSKWYDDK